MNEVRGVFSAAKNQKFARAFVPTRDDKPIFYYDCWTIMVLFVAKEEIGCTSSRTIVLS